MLKPISRLLVGVASSVATSIYYGGGIVETAVVGIVAGNASLILWVFGSYTAQRTWRPFIDAETIVNGVCPSCRTFGSLTEVTSADPLFREAHCQACKDNYSLSFRNGRIAADWVGKSGD